jgi:DNA adenine methylase Dam
MFVETPFNFTGSKFKLLEQLLPEFDYTKKNFIDVFCGGGSVYSNVVDKYNKVLVNDIISDLIGIHKGILEGDDIINKTKELSPQKGEKDKFLQLRESYNLDKSAEKLWALMLSSTNNMMRFNQKFEYNQTFGERGWNINTDKKVDVFKNHIRQYKDRLKFISNHFSELPKRDDVFYYMDPPYGRVKEKSGEIGKSQISEAGYNAFWKLEDDKKLYDFIHEVNSLGATFVVSGVLSHSGKTCWMLDKLIGEGFNYKVMEFDYNKVSRSGDKETKEIIIKNF